MRRASLIHVRRKSNMLAHHIANEGELCKEIYSSYAWDSTPLWNLWEDCQRQAEKYMEKFHTIRFEQEERLVEVEEGGVVSLS